MGRIFATYLAARLFSKYDRRVDAGQGKDSSADVPVKTDIDDYLLRDK